MTSAEIQAVIQKSISMIRKGLSLDAAGIIRAAAAWEIAYQLAVHNEREAKSVPDTRGWRYDEKLRIVFKADSNIAIAALYGTVEETKANGMLIASLGTANIDPESPEIARLLEELRTAPKPAPEGMQSILDRQFIDFVSTEPLEVIKENECDPGDLAGSRFRRVFNEIAQLRQAKKVK